MWRVRETRELRETCVNPVKSRTTYTLLFKAAYFTLARIGLAVAPQTQLTASRPGGHGPRQTYTTRVYHRTTVEHTIQKKIDPNTCTKYFIFTSAERKPHSPLSRSTRVAGALDGRGCAAAAAEMWHQLTREQHSLDAKAGAAAAVCSQWAEGNQRGSALLPPPLSLRRAYRAKKVGPPSGHPRQTSRKSAMPAQARTGMHTLAEHRAPR